MKLLVGGLIMLVSHGFVIAQDPPVPTTKPRVTIEKQKGRYRIEIDGKLFTNYIFEGWPNPILYPIHGAHGMPMTRNHPMATGKDEAKDHKHHRSLWFAHGAMNGHDFWSGADMRVVQEKAVTSQGDNVAIITAFNSWVAGKELVCKDKRTIAFHSGPAGRFIDYEVVFLATEGDVVFGDTKEGTIAIRLTPTLRLKGKVAAGHIRNSEGVKDGKAWGKRAKWVDYYGRVAGKTVGVAIFDHPDNHGHPCHWHARDYGLFAANPWGKHQFGGGKKRAGEMTLRKGKAMRLRYRFYFHAGDTKQANVAAQYSKFAMLPATTSIENEAKAASTGKK